MTANLGDSLAGLTVYSCNEEDPYVSIKDTVGGLYNSFKKYIYSVHSVWLYFLLTLGPVWERRLSNQAKWQPHPNWPCRERLLPFGGPWYVWSLNSRNALWGYCCLCWKWSYTNVKQFLLTVHNSEEDSLYVHHDILLPAYPLCLEWLNFDPNPGEGSGRKLCIHSTTPTCL